MCGCYAPATADLRSTPRMLQAGGPFNAVAHTAEMRRPESGAGRYNIPNVGIFLWRLQPFRLSDVPLTPHPGDATGRKFRFNPLGADQQLFRRPVTETVISHIAEPANVPDPINLRLMALAVRSAATDPTVADDYGEGDSIVLSRPDPDPAKPPIAVAVTDICVGDLRDVPGGWAHEALADSVNQHKICIDPRLGRVLLGASVSGPLLASFHSGFSRPIGGGEYERSPSRRSRGDPAQRGPRRTLATASRCTSPPADGSIIEDSLTYAQTPVFKVNGVTDPGAPGLEVVVTARDGARPLIALAPEYRARHRRARPAGARGARHQRRRVAAHGRGRHRAARARAARLHAGARPGAQSRRHRRVAGRAEPALSSIPSPRSRWSAASSGR